MDVIDVNTQQQIEMSMANFAKYYSNTQREKIYNVISLEFSHTRLENHVETPLLVSTVQTRCLRQKLKFYWKLFVIVKYSTDCVNT